MKARIILLLLVCFSCTAFAQSNKTIITSWGQISLAGDWKGGDFGDGYDDRSIVCIPVGASLENAIITLDLDSLSPNTEYGLKLSHNFFIGMNGHKLKEDFSVTFKTAE